MFSPHGLEEQRPLEYIVSRDGRQKVLLSFGSLSFKKRMSLKAALHSGQLPVMKVDPPSLSRDGMRPNCLKFRVTSSESPRGKSTT